MGSWQVGLAANVVIAGCYLGICWSIVMPLHRSRQLRTNALAGATAAIFFTCAVHHGAHAVHMALPSLGLDDADGLAMRQAWGWPLATWDIVGAIVAVYYLSLRRLYSSMLVGPALFQDFRLREQQALELNDEVLQGLVVATMALDLDQPQKAREALAASMGSANRIISGLLGSQHHDLDLIRSVPAGLSPTPAVPAPPERTPR
jgi:hypothetical protein